MLQLANEGTDMLFDTRTITYEQFDKYDAQMSKLMMTLYELDPDPVNEGGIKFVQDVAKIIASSNNILPFPKRRPSKP